MAAEYELSLHDYLSILRRRIWQILAIFALVLSIATALAVLMPPVYESTGTILVESQQISSDLVKANETAFADERIEVIKQRVMTRDNLYKIIQKYKLYSNELQKASTSEVIDQMRRSINVNLLSSNPGNVNKASTIAFKVSFEDKNPEVAHKVASELVTLFLDENVKSRTEKATETTEFLSQEVETLRKELENTETKVAAFKEKYAGALPEHMDMHMSMLQRSERDINDIDRDYKAAQEELRYLDVELTSAKSGINNRQSNVSTPVATADAELDKAKLELERATAIYSDSHPTVKALIRKIENLEQAAAKENKAISAGKPKNTNIETDLMVAKVQAQIEAAKARLSSLADQKISMRKKVDTLQAQISRSPEVEKGLFSLMRDYENAKAKYEEVKSKQINARIAENLEQENKAERFAMLEPPSFPEKPVRPDRLKIMLIGLFGGLLAALGGVLVLESINASVRSAEALNAITNVRTMVTIPYIYTLSEVRRKKYLYKYISIGLVGFISITLLLIHFLWMPLDLLMVKLLNRFS
jgi:polysaccharide biosynthesis transport protein